MTGDSPSEEKQRPSADHKQPIGKEGVKLWEVGGTIRFDHGLCPLLSTQLVHLGSGEATW